NAKCELFGCSGGGAIRDRAHRSTVPISAVLPALQLNDQFGSRLVTPSTPKLLYAPVAPMTTTTTTTAAPTTTTTMAPTTHTVEVAPNVMLMYSPSTVVIHTGDTVQWIFKSGPHTVTSGTNCVATRAVR